MADLGEGSIRYEVILGVDGLGLDFEGLEETPLRLLDQGPLLVGVEQVFGHLSLQHDVLVKELHLVPEILLHDVAQEPHMGQVASSLQDHLHFFRG